MLKLQGRAFKTSFASQSNLITLTVVGKIRKHEINKRSENRYIGIDDIYNDNMGNKLFKRA